MTRQCRCSYWAVCYDEVREHARERVEYPRPEWDGSDYWDDPVHLLVCRERDPE
jgi:hypothetical protein